MKIGLEAFNGFAEDGRTTKTLLHLQHACEMLLKACASYSKYRYIYSDNRVYLVEPSNSEVITVID